MRKSLKTTLVAVVTLVAVNLATIETASAGKTRIHVRNSILGLGLIGLLSSAGHSREHYSQDRRYYEPAPRRYYEPAPRPYYHDDYYYRDDYYEGYGHRHYYYDY